MPPVGFYGPSFLQIPRPATGALLQVTATQTPVREPSSPSGILSHPIAIAAITASLIAAGVGAGVLIWKRRNSAPNDGIPRTPSQLKSFQQAARWEKALSGADKHKRRAAIQPLVNLVPSLAPQDAVRVIRRLAIQFCMEWNWIIDDPKTQKTLRDKVIRWPQSLSDQLIEYISERLDDRQSNIQTNARAAIKLLKK